MATLSETLRTSLSRIAALFRRSTLDAELEEELHTHIDMAMEEHLQRGLSRKDARRAALSQFGGVTQTRESYRHQRSLPMIETLGQDLRFSLRMLFKSRGFTAAAILTLALGIGANTAIFSVVKAVLMAPLPYKDPSRIVAVWTASPARGGQALPSSPADFALWKQKSGIFEDLAPSYDNEVTLTGQGAPQFLLGYAVSANYLRILGVAPQIGRLYNDEEDRPGGPKVALLSDHLWRTTFHADPNIAGKAITLDGASYTVLGVMPRGFDYPSDVELWMPLGLAPSALSDFQHTYIRILGKLKSGITLAQARQAVNALETQIAAAHPDTDTGNRVVLTPLREQLDGDIRKPLLILMGAVVLVLLIACANTAGLALARDAERQKEIAVRLALGATRQRLLRQFLTESLLLSALGGAAGLLLALAATRTLLSLFPNDVANLQIPKLTAIPIDGGVLLFSLITTLLTGLLFGIAPVLKAMRAETSYVAGEPLRGTTASRQSNRSRGLIVIAQVAISLILLAGAGLVVASFQRVVNSSLGFHPDHVLALQVFLPPDRYPRQDRQKQSLFVDEVVRRMNAMPGVQSAAATNFLPLIGFWGTTNFVLRGQALPKDGQAPEADERVITPGYLSAMGIPLLRGRTFTEADNAGSAQVAMINQKLAREYFAGRDPVGEELNLGTAAKPDWWRIVGVAGDVKAFGQDQPTHLDIYQPFAQRPYSIVAFTLRTQADPASMMKIAEQTLWSVDPDLPVFKAIPMEVLAAQSLALRRTSSVLISGFALLALALASVGIYGVMAYAVTQRTPEIGVRMALGAQRPDVLRMILGLGLRMTLAGAILGLAGALALTRLLQSLLFETSAMNPLVFAAATALLLSFAALASYLPARHAASIEPMQALRTE